MCGAVMVPALGMAPVSTEVLPICPHAHLQGLQEPASLVLTLLVVPSLECSASPPPFAPLSTLIPEPFPSSLIPFEPTESTQPALTLQAGKLRHGERIHHSTCLNRWM